MNREAVAIGLEAPPDMIERLQHLASEPVLGARDSLDRLGQGDRQIADPVCGRRVTAEDDACGTRQRWRALERSPLSRDLEPSLENVQPHKLPRRANANLLQSLGQHFPALVLNELGVATLERRARGVESAGERRMGCRRPAKDRDMKISQRLGAPASRLDQLGVLTESRHGECRQAM